MIFDYLYFKHNIKEFIVSDINNNYAISWFYSKNIVLFAGNMLQQSFIAPIDEIIIIPKPYYKNYDEPLTKKQRINYLNI